MWSKKWSSIIFCLIFVILNIAHLTLGEDGTKEYKVVIVGAGPAGLHAAYNLAENGITDVIILEAQDQIGGRIKSMQINGDWIELGAQWIHGQGENPLWKFAVEKEIPISEETARGGEGVFIRDDGKEIPTKILQETAKNFVNVREESCGDDDDDVKDSKEVDDEDVQSIGDIFDEEFNSWLSTEKAGDDPDSTVWRKQLHKWLLKTEQWDSACDNVHNQSSISWCDYEEFEPDTSFLNGYQSLLNVWKDYLSEKDVNILTNTRVDKIRWQNSNGKVVVGTEDEKSFEADHVIVTVSLGYLKQHQSGIFVPELPQDKVKVIDTLKFGTVNKIFLEFEMPFWNLDNPGFMFLYSGDELDQKIDEKNWVQNLIGFDAVLKQPNMLLGWIAGQPARNMELLSNDDISVAVLNHLTDLMRKWKQDPNFNLPELKQIIVTRWNSDPNVLGSYSFREIDSDLVEISHSNMSVPVMINGAPKVLFAGEATIDEYFGTVHGAMESAHREVERIIDF